MTLTDEQRELLLYVQNTATIWSNRVEPSFRNFQRKQRKGTYDGALAVKGLRDAVDEAAKMYRREFATATDMIFSVADRHAVAVQLRDDFESEIAAGCTWIEPIHTSE